MKSAGLLIPELAGLSNFSNYERIAENQSQ